MTVNVNCAVFYYCMLLLHILHILWHLLHVMQSIWYPNHWLDAISCCLTDSIEALRELHFISIIVLHVIIDTLFGLIF